ncbi:hypothetical protein [Thalassotalea piscium]|uniref:Uncharacterized protein n=1 Tax=Thalassotalea piscium TaxID=1230533 RepID=A0A7X0TV20_9GAMM|nr:hypothetical protein [Thalassotalea piscium]MBB6544798.1 hypothetical protein [Thalassotalea piscium]
MNYNKEFYQGVIWACARINELHDQPAIANDVLQEANISDEDFKQAAEYDLEFLRDENPKIPQGQE